MTAYGRSGIGKGAIYENTVAESKLVSFRIINKGTSTAYITIHLPLNSEIIPMTPINLRLDSGDMVEDTDLNFNIPKGVPVVLESDSGDLYYWLVFE